MKKTFIILFSLCILLAYHCQGQDYYYGEYDTKNSKLLIGGTFDKDSFLITGKSVSINVNNATGSIEISIPVKYLSVNNPKVQKVLDSLKIETVEFKGFLGVSKVETEPHPVQNFPVTGEATAGSLKFPLSGSAVLEHLHISGQYACMLDLRFDVRLNNKQISIPDGMSENLKVVVSKVILRQYNGSGSH